MPKPKLEDPPQKKNPLLSGTFIFDKDIEVAAYSAKQIEHRLVLPLTQLEEA